MIAVVDYGMGNLRSVARALEAAGGRDVRVTQDPADVRAAARVVVPGQGAFADCMQALARGGLDDALRDTWARGTPYLGICLGLQVLFEESEEHGPVRGLGLLPGRVRRLVGGRPAGAPADAAPIEIPHMGWNSVALRPDVATAWGAPSGAAHYYFVHSYFCDPGEAGASLVAGTAHHGEPFCAAVAHDHFWAVQFHPEKSQHAGLALLRAFVERPLS